jgi:hypothetical protein
MLPYLLLAARPEAPNEFLFFFSPGPITTMQLHETALLLFSYRWGPGFWSAPPSATREGDEISGLRRQIDIVHKQRVDARFAECDDCVGRCADDWFAIVEGRIDDERHAGSGKETGYELVKAWI